MNTAYNMDCLEAMKGMKDNEFDLAIVDVPYGINRDGQKEFVSKRKPKQNKKYFESKKWDNSIPSREYFNQLFRVSKNQIMWGANYFLEYLHNTKSFIIWYKGQKGLKQADCEIAWTSFNEPIRLIEINRAIFLQENTIHPTQKPVKLYKFCLELFAKQGDKILDTHLGSGSSRIACYDLGFDFVGYELDKEYFEAQEKRFTNHINQEALFTPEQINF